MLYGTIALKLIIGLAALIIVMRLLGKKEMSAITPFDLIYTMLLGGIVEESLFSKKISILHMLFGLAMWVSLSILLKFLSRSLKKPLKGEPSELIVDGRLNHKELEKNHIEVEQLRAMLREKGIFSLKDVHYALLETSGSISVIDM
ncbi:DUF421 domain-containing protein [Bacillus sp. V5-8f]|uniref:DUF421 domain-containing protein n=1 Tax=Bacillus sp. V5-8f TaxID=2053044 RepID=UPI000C770355|nr:YetF domain-containing protein [Bacillus sp. V5-8f]PLT35817.1 hypothetical protein CUU64_00650 [Bacillus sp. V5-8f]